MTANSIKSSKAFSVFKDSAICIVVLTAATLAGYAFKAFQLADADIIMLYIIAVLVISIFTSKMYFCLISSLVGVMLFNCFFTYPEFSLSVHDAGYLVTFEEKEKVFDMFYTGGSRSSDSRRSLGLGLALCRSIITSHGGTISVSDNIPNGTVVSFTLPIGEVDLNE